MARTRSFGFRLTALFLALFMLLISSMTPLSVWAQAADQLNPADGQVDNAGEPPTQTDIEALNEAHPYFDPHAEAEGCGVGGPTLTLTGSGNEENVMLFIFTQLTKLGVSAQTAAYAAAGVAGNIRQESGFNPASNIPTVTSNPAHGLAQWEGGRWTALQKFAAARGKPVTDLGVQLDFLWSELPTQRSFGHLAELQAIMPSATASTSTLAVLRVASSPAFAAQGYELTFERAGDPRMPKRITYANDSYARYGVKLAGSTGSSPAGASQSAACSDAGIGNVVEGYSFPLAPQTQINYIGLPCPGPGEIPGYPAKGTVGVYNPAHGESETIRTCHHAPLSPAFDLYYGPNQGGMPVGAAGKPIYAITDGDVSSVNWSYCNPSACGASGKYCTSINFHSSTDKFYYWYGHVLAKQDYRSISKGKGLKAGTQIGTTATVDYGGKCWGGAPHLHIDRGCHQGTTYYTGGGTSCRDPDFMLLLHKIWLGLPKG